MRNHRPRQSSPGPSARGTLAAVLTAAALCLALPGRAAAQEPGTFVRLYYSSWMSGDVKTSPADPGGLYADGAGLSQNHRAGLEAIFLRRVGFSFSRQKLQRAWLATAGGVAGCASASCEVEERGVMQSIDLTVYGREVAHDQFNLFLGGGAGEMDYEYFTDGVRQTHGELYDNLSLSRWFFGVEYTFERIGFRLEVSTARAHKTLPDTTPQTAEFEGAFRYFTVVIPLN